MMTKDQSEYYANMFMISRAIPIYVNGDIVGIATFFVGDNDKKFIHEKKPWEIVDDDPEGKTLYVDQFICKGKIHKQIHKIFSESLMVLKNDFKNIEKVKWVRTCARLRKHGLTKGVKRYVRCKDIK